MKTGNVYLIPNLMGEEDTINEVLPPHILSVVNTIDVFIVENVKTARRYLKKLSIETPLNDLVLLPLNKHTTQEEIQSYLADTTLNYGVISEAGVPAVADPGAVIVAMAHRKKMKVLPLVGPSSILLAIMGSGFNGQSFAFHGYLPIESSDRTKRLKELEAISKRHNQTQLFIETPFRNNKFLDALLKSLQPGTGLCIACNLTQSNEMITTKTIGEWKKSKPDLHKKPTVFVIQG